MPILGFSYFGKTCIDFCQIKSISECKYISYMVDLFDFSAISKDAYKNKSFHGILKKI